MTERHREPPARARHRDPVVGLRRLRHPLRHLPAGRAPARRLRARRRRRRGPPPDRHRRRGRAALPVGRDRRLRRAARAHRGARAARRRGQPEPLPGPRLQARLDHAPGRAACARRRSRTCSSASRSRPSWARPRSRCGSPTAPTTPARTTCASAAAGWSTRCRPSTPQLPADQEHARRVQALRARLLRHRPRRLGLVAARLPEARRARAGARRPRPPRPGREHRADRRAARRGGPARRLPLQQPQVRRRRPDRRLGQPVRAVPDLLRARGRRRCRG